MILLILELKFQKNYPQFQSRYNKTKSFNSQYSFRTFIEGKDNQFAKAACVSVADSPGSTPFNPLLIYSATGLGKTHLLQAIGNGVIKKYPNYQITYLTSERFMLEFISSIQKNKSTDFANQYRSSDILLIDDVQFFEGKEQTQEEGEDEKQVDAQINALMGENSKHSGA